VEEAFRSGGGADAPGAREIKPREGTKREKVLAMLRRPEAATVAEIAEATGWAPHMVSSVRSACSSAASGASSQLALSAIWLSANRKARACTGVRCSSVIAGTPRGRTTGRS
jgi:Protein of unknown function (DUF3489)